MSSVVIANRPNCAWEQKRGAASWQPCSIVMSSAAIANSPNYAYEQFRGWHLGNHAPLWNQEIT